MSDVDVTRARRSRSRRSRSSCGSGRRVREAEGGAARAGRERRTVRLRRARASASARRTRCGSTSPTTRRPRDAAARRSAALADATVATPTAPRASRDDELLGASSAARVEAQSTACAPTLGEFDRVARRHDASRPRRASVDAGHREGDRRGPGPPPPAEPGGRVRRARPRRGSSQHTLISPVGRVLPVRRRASRSSSSSSSPRASASPGSSARSPSSARATGSRTSRCTGGRSGCCCSVRPRVRRSTCRPAGSARGPFIGTSRSSSGSISLYGGSSTLEPAVVGDLARVRLGTVAVLRASGMTAVIRARFSTPTVGREGMIGEMGVAEVAVDPDGVVLDPRRAVAGAHEPGDADRRRRRGPGRRGRGRGARGRAHDRGRVDYRDRARGRKARRDKGEADAEEPS